MDHFGEFPFALPFGPDAVGSEPLAGGNDEKKFHLQPRPSPFGACRNSLGQKGAEYEENGGEDVNARSAVHFISIDWQKERCCPATPSPPPLTLKPRPRVGPRSKLLFKQTPVRCCPPPKLILMPDPMSED